MIRSLAGGAVSLALSVLVAAPAHAQQLVQVSTASDNTPANGASSFGALSADSQWIAFASTATNLVANDTNDKWDVFVKNLQTNAVVRASVASDGTERSENSGFEGLDISQNGQVVVFTSSAALVADDTNTCTLEDATTGPCPDIYVRDRVANTTTRISLGLGGIQADGRSQRPRISNDGRYIVFSSFATNLVAADTNNVEDVFLHDRTAGTTTRISVASDGSQANAVSQDAEISGDGGSVAFLSAATNLSTTPDPLPCFTGLLAGPCLRAFVYERSTGATTAIRVTAPPEPGPTPTGAVVGDVSIDHAGRFVAVGVARERTAPPSGSLEFSVMLYDRVQQQTVRTLGPVIRNGGFTGAAISGDGRVVMHGGGFHQMLVTAITTTFSAFDRHTGLFEPAEMPGPISDRHFPDPELSSDGRLVVTSGDQVFLFKRDVDDDGIADTWETRFGLNPASNADAALDLDSDGRTNLQEYQAGSHPAGTVTRYFAEGASNDFFRTRIALLNTSTSTANVVLRFLGSGGGNTASTLQSVPAQTRVTFDLGPGANVPANDFSTVIESDQPFAADRTMTWDTTGFGAHAETSIPSPALNWFLAEGATHGAFDLFYLLQNPNDTEVMATVTYLRPAPLVPIVKVYTLAANSRQTIWVDTEHIDLIATDVSAQIVATQPIIVERAMYTSPAGQPAFVAGHDGAGVTAPSNTWFLAEGATGGFFDLFVLIANPGVTDATATVSYLLPSGERFSKNYVVARQSRLTIGVDGEDPRLQGTSVAVIVEATQPVIVERAMWWPSPLWHEGHLAVGATTTGTRWALAEGEVGVNATTGADTETYILIANTGSAEGSATLTLFHESDPAIPTSQLVVPLPANSRVTVPVSASFPATAFGPTRRFGAIIESTGAPIVVERAMYTTANGVFWSAGTSSLATKLQ